MSNAERLEPLAPLLRMHDDGPLRILTLNEPARRNPLSSAMLDELRGAIALAVSAPGVRAVIIAAEGPAFSAGHDLKEIQAARAASDRGRAFFEALMAQCSALMLAIRDCPKPVIAAVEGIATAAGCQLVATCDLAVAGAQARFATPGVQIGLFCSTPMVALSRTVSPKHAMEMLLTGEMIDAQAAYRIGLVNRVVPAGEALGAALALGETIAAKPPATLRIGKQAFYRQREMALEDAYAYASRVMVENLLHREAEEGIAAFTNRKTG
jgi:enoyl-CoA hydratase/carnithine racemase